MLSFFSSPRISVADPKQKFRIRFWIRIRPKVSFGFGSGFESGSKSGFESGFGSQIRTRIRILDSDLDQKLAKTSVFFCSKIFTQPHLRSSKIKRLLSLSSVTWLRTRCAINLQDSDPDPLVRGTDPRIRILTKKSRIHNTAHNYF